MEGKRGAPQNADYSPQGIIHLSEDFSPDYSV